MPHRFAPGTPEEGVIRFRAVHRHEPPEARHTSLLAPLLPWRRVIRSLGVLGQDLGRYGGYGYGNLSVRLGATAFLISGSQTSGLPDVGPEHFARVDGFSLEENRVRSRGPVVPSSESLTHAALYAASRRVGAVFHVHAPRLWAMAGPLGLPATPPGAEAGTVELALAIHRLARHLTARERGEAGLAGVISLAGHEDGLLAYGPDAEAAGRSLVRMAVRAARVRR